MKEAFNKNSLIWVVGVAALAIELIIANIHLSELTVFTYLLVIGIIPAILLLGGALLFGLKSDATKAFKYVVSLALAVVFSVIVLGYCTLFVDEELITTIVQNTVSDDGILVSVNMASAGDNIQSILLYIAFSGIGCFIGTHMHKKKNKARTIEESNANEYD